MKKRFALLLGALLCALYIAAQADTPAPWGLYVQANGYTALVSTAVPAEDGVMLTVAPVISSDMPLIVRRGSEELPVLQVATLESGLTVLYVDGVDSPLPAIAQTHLGSATVASVNAYGEAIARGQINTTVQWHGLTCPLLLCGGDVLPGALVTDAEGALVGMVAAEWLDQANAWVVLPAAAMTDARARADAALQPVVESELPLLVDGWVTAFDMETDGMRLTLHLPLDVPAVEGGRFTAFLAGLNNPYYSYVPVSDVMTELPIYLPPEQAYAVWLHYGTEEYSALMPGEYYQYAQTGKAPAFADYNYRETELYVGLIPAEAEQNSVRAEAVDTVTAAMLADETVSVCMQAVSVYEVTETITVDMQTVLTTPEGFTFTLDSGFIFSPEMAAEDVWNCPLDMLLNNYLRFSGTAAPGEYRIDNYFDGKYVSTVTFMVE